MKPLMRMNSNNLLGQLDGDFVISCEIIYISCIAWVGKYTNLRSKRIAYSL